MATQLIAEVVAQLEVLPPESQRRVLDFARALAISIPRGIPGRELLRFAGTISQDDLRLIENAILRDCEQVDVNGW